MWDTWRRHLIWRIHLYFHLPFCNDNNEVSLPICIDPVIISTIQMVEKVSLCLIAFIFFYSGSSSGFIYSNKHPLMQLFILSNWMELSVAKRSTICFMISYKISCPKETTHFFFHESGYVNKDPERSTHWWQSCDFLNFTNKLSVKKQNKTKNVYGYLMISKLLFF